MTLMFSIKFLKYLKYIGIKHFIIMIKLANIYTVFGQMTFNVDNIFYVQ